MTTHCIPKIREKLDACPILPSQRRTRTAPHLSPCDSALLRGHSIGQVSAGHGADLPTAKVIEGLRVHRVVAIGFHSSPGVKHPSDIGVAEGSHGAAGHDRVFCGLQTAKEGVDGTWQHLILLHLVAQASIAPKAPRVNDSLGVGTNGVVVPAGHVDNLLVCQRTQHLRVQRERSQGAGSNQAGCQRTGQVFSWQSVWSSMSFPSPPWTTPVHE